MQLAILILMLAFALGCFFLAWLREEAGDGYAMLAGFVILLLAGLVLLVTGVNYQVGSSTVTTVVNLSTTTAVTSYTYAGVTIWELTILSITLIVTGFWGVLAVATNIRER